MVTAFRIRIRGKSAGVEGLVLISPPILEEVFNVLLARTGNVLCSVASNKALKEKALDTGKQSCKCTVELFVLKVMLQLYLYLLSSTFICMCMV